MTQKLIALSVYDLKTEEHTTPHYAKTKAEAIRAFENACKNPETNLYKYPSDYSLKQIGIYNTTTAEFNNLPQSIELAHASEFSTIQ